MKKIRNEDSDEGRLADWLLLRSDRAFMVTDAYSFTRPDTPASIEDMRNGVRGSYPIWSNTAETIEAFVKQAIPEKLDLLYDLFDQFREIDRSWPDPRKDKKPKPKRFEVDFEELRRNARRKYISGDKGYLREEVYVNDTI